MHWEFNLYELPLVVSGSVSLLVAGLAWRRHSTPGRNPLVWMMLALAVWSFGNVLEHGSKTLEDMLFWASTEYVPTMAVPVLWLLFVISYFGLSGPRGPRLYGWFAIVPALTVLVVATNSYHSLYWRDIRLDSTGPYWVFTKSYGPAAWLAIVHNYVVLAAGAYLVVRTLLRSKGLFRLQAIIVLVGTLPPWIANVVYVFGQKHGVRVDITPIAFTIGGIAGVFAVSRFGLLDIVPSARDAVIESMSDALFVFDPHDRLVDVNPAGIQLMGTTDRQAVVGRTVDEALGPVPGLSECYRALPAHGGQTAFCRPRTDRYYDLSVSPVHDRRGRPTARVLILRDVSSRKQLETKFQQSQKLEAIGLLAGGIAHHFNNQLTVINGYSQLALSALSADNPIRQDIQAIFRAGQQAADLTRRLLVFGRRQKTQAVVLDVNDLLDGMSRMLRMLTGEDVELTLDLAPVACLIKADPSQIEQIIANLVANARDAMPNGGALRVVTRHAFLESGEVTSHARIGPGHYVVLLVSDTGVGMTAEVQAHLFEPFFTTKDVGRGTGLGLASVYGAVQELRGYIDVATAPGEGTTFRIYLPFSEEPLWREVTDDQGSGLPRGRETVLVVEDETYVRELVADVLGRQGYQVMQASDGIEALERVTLAKGRVDLIVSDVVMPRLGGLELYRELVSRDLVVPMLFMSGYPDESNSLSAVTAEGVPFIRKPFALESIVAKVREVLDA